MANPSAPTDVVLVSFDDLDFMEEITSCGFSRVFRAIWQRQNAVEVAVKHMNSRERTEFKIHSTLDHPNIVKVLGVVDEFPKFYSVFELCEGGNLRSYLDKHKHQPLPPDLFNAWSQQAARAIEYLHENGIIHPDIKSYNYLIKRQNILKLSDFGISKEADETVTTAIKGTLAWTAPEVFVENHISPLSDIYSYGNVLWELITRKFPFEGYVFQTILYRVGAKGERLPIPADCPTYLAYLLKWCWKEDRHERPNIKEILLVLTKNQGPIKQASLHEMQPGSPSEQRETKGTKHNYCYYLLN